MLYLVLRFLPIVLFISFLLWLKFRKQNPMQAPDKALRYWIWAIIISLGLCIFSLVYWGVNQHQSAEAEKYQHEHAH